MSDIQIDFSHLISARDRLDSVISQFRDAGEIHAQLPAATGHYRVEGAVREFRDAWHVRRDQLTEELIFVRDAVEAIHDTFRALDDELAARVGAFTDSETRKRP